MGKDVGAIVRQVQDGDHLLQISLLPKTSLRFEFSYCTEMLATLQRSENKYLGSVVYGAIYAEDRLLTEGEDKRTQQRRQGEADALAKVSSVIGAVPHAEASGSKTGNG